MRFTERVGQALISDDLTMRLDRGCDADVLVALGWVAQREPLGGALLRLQLTHDVDYLEQAVDAARGQAELIKRRWKLPKGDGFWRRVCEQAVSYWVNAVCRRCRGRCFETIKDTGRLGTTRCTACHGTGRRPYPKIGPESMESELWRPRFSELLTALDSHADRTLRQARRVLQSRAAQAP